MIMMLYNFFCPTLHSGATPISGSAIIQRRVQDFSLGPRPNGRKSRPNFRRPRAGWGLWGDSKPPPHQLGVWGALWAPLVGFGAELRPPKGFPPFSALRNGLSWHYNIVSCGLSCKTPCPLLRTPLMLQHPLLQRSVPPLTSMREISNRPDALVVTQPTVWKHWRNLELPVINRRKSLCGPQLSSATKCLVPPPLSVLQASLLRPCLVGWSSPLKSEGRRPTKQGHQFFHHQFFVIISLQCFDTVGWAIGRVSCIRPVKKLGVGLLVVTFWLEVCTSYSSSRYHHIHHP